MSEYRSGSEKTNIVDVSSQTFETVGNLPVEALEGARRGFVKVVEAVSSRI